MFSELMWCEFTGGMQEMWQNWWSFRLLHPTAFTIIKLALLKMCFFTALLHRSFRSSFTSSVKPSLEVARSAQALVLCSSSYPVLRRGGGREDLHVCKSASELISDLLQNKIIVCLSRKDRFCMDKNVVHLVCRGDTIGMYNLVNVRKVVNCINSKPSWLSIKWK